MKDIYGIFIEADPTNSLGGSCIRDLYNLAKHISNINKSTNYNCNHLYILTNHDLLDKRDRFPKENISFHIINDIISQVNSFIQNIPKNTILILFISGHGYQTFDNSGDEIDNLDEYVKTRNGIY